MTASETIAALQAALAAEREALVAYYKLQIAKLRREQYGQSAERGRKLLDQLELQLEEAAASAAEDEIRAAPVGSTTVQPFTRKKPVRAPFPAHLPRERVVIPGPSACPCCGGRLAKLGETITETLEVVPRQWKVIQTVREKFTCRACETITRKRCGGTTGVLGLTAGKGPGWLSTGAGRATAFAGLAARFSGAIRIADGAGGSDGMGDLCVGGGLPAALFRGRHIGRQIEFALAVDQDREQHLAVLCEQDALPPFLGA